MYLVFLFVNGFIKIIKETNYYSTSFIDREKPLCLNEKNIESILKQQNKVYKNVKYIDSVYIENHTYDFIKNSICKDIFYEQLDLKQLKKLIDCTNKTKEMFINNVYEDTKTKKEGPSFFNVRVSAEAAQDILDNSKNTKDNFKPLYTIDDEKVSFVNKVYIRKNIEMEKKSNLLYYNTHFKTIYITPTSLYKTYFPEFEFSRTITNSIKEKLENFIIPNITKTTVEQVGEILDIIEKNLDNSLKLNRKAMLESIKNNYEKSGTDIKDNDKVIREIQQLLHIKSEDLCYSRILISEILHELGIETVLDDEKIKWKISKINKIDYSKNINDILNDTITKRIIKNVEPLQYNDPKTINFQKMLQQEESLSAKLLEFEKSKIFGFGPLKQEYVEKGNNSENIRDSIEKKQNEYFYPIN